MKTLLLVGNLLLSPGVSNPAVNQENIHSTICVVGWTETIRPPVSYTNRVKVAQIKARNLPDKNLADYEEDHVENLGLGGHPTDIGNLQPQLYAGICGARKKDVIETKLNRLVCSGKITLVEAQKEISQNWVAAYEKWVGPLECK